MTEQALVGNAADPAQVKDAARKERRAETQQLDDLRQVVSSRSGRRFLWGLLCDVRLFESECHAEVHRQYFTAGERNVGCRLLARINDLDPALYHIMAQEAQKEGS